MNRLLGILLTLILVLRQAESISCYFCLDQGCLYEDKGRIEDCGQNVTTCQKINGVVNGLHHVMRMCGLPNSNFTVNQCYRLHDNNKFPHSDDEDKDGIVDVGNTPQRKGFFVYSYGIFCYCDSDKCNGATAQTVLNSRLRVQIWLLFLLIVYR